MNIGKFVPTVATLIVAVVVMAGVAFPMIGNLSAETTTISNDGASWIRMAYITDQSDYSVEYTFGDNVSVAGQSGEWEDMILYADSQCTICIVGDYLVKVVGDVAAVSDDPQTVTVSRSNGIVSIDGEPVSESTVSWAYVPVADGKYGSFGADTVPLHRNSPLATVGGFAGVYAYNENVSMDVGLVMDANVTEQYINSVRWALASDIETVPIEPVDPNEIEDPFDPDSLTPIDIDNPFQPNENQIMSVPTPTYTDGDWGYEYQTVSGVQKAKIVAYVGSGGGAITIPATVGGYDVYSIGSGMNGQTVFDVSVTSTSLTISNGINVINNYAFTNCSNLGGSLVLSNTLTSIGNNAFAGCSGLTGTLEIPASVTTLSRSSFKDCTGFTALVLNEGLQKILNPSTGAINGCFAGCTGLTGVLTIPSTVTEIGNSTFSGCAGLTGLVINGSPDLKSGMDNNGVFYNCTGITGSVNIPAGTKLGGYDFRGCTNITSITLPNTITTLPNGVFQGCTSLATINLGSVTSIGSDAFENCGLQSVTLSENLTAIGVEAFNGCADMVMDAGSLPSALTQIGQGAFNGCTKIEGALVIPQGVATVSPITFAGCTGITGLELGAVSTIGNEAFRGCTGMVGVLVIPSSVTTIGSRAFQNCNFTSMVVLSDAEPPTTINNYAFSNIPISQVLNLSNNEWTTTSYGLNAEEVRTDIGATSYVAPVSISETTTKEGPTFDLLAMLPIVFVAGLLLTTAWLFIRK